MIERAGRLSRLNTVNRPVIVHFAAVANRGFVANRRIIARIEDCRIEDKRTRIGGSALLVLVFFNQAGGEILVCESEIGIDLNGDCETSFPRVRGRVEIRKVYPDY